MTYHVPRHAGLAICLSLMTIAAMGFALPAPAQAPAAEASIEGFDMATVIRAAANRKAGTMKIGIAQAVKQLDAILLSDYGARGRIGGEPSARLKSLYTQAAHLLMNGQAIAGGTLVVIARQEPAYARSACGPALAAFIDGMLAPLDEEDPILGAYAVRAAKARGVLAKLPPQLQMAAQLRVMGAIYRDDIAVDAGAQALLQQGATAAQLAIVQAALQAGGVR